jgi:hypothetical protein
MGGGHWHKGGCHCGAVEFEMRLHPPVKALNCTCSICRMTGFQHLIAGKDDFRLIKGEGALTSYRFNTGAADHLFCRHCGVKSFYVPRSHPDGYSVNLRCLDPENLPDVYLETFDGANWEQNIASIRNQD